MNKIAFITEMGFSGKISNTHENMRTEFAWMFALDANHHCIHQWETVQNYDHVFVIFPKGKLNLSAEGSTIANHPNPASALLQLDLISKLKQQNKKVYYIQEGPTWWFNDYEVQDQILFYNMLASVDAIYAHNQHDMAFYRGLVPRQTVRLITTLMIDTHIKDIIPEPQDKVLIGGNFSRWYNGFQSYLVASEFDLPIWAQESHSKRENEDQIDNLNHFPRMMWNQWMREVSKFKYAVHLMPTVAAGTFSLNCAYFGIPCIGNKNVDTQRLCYPELSVDVDDVESARALAKKLKNKEFYTQCSTTAKQMYRKHYDLDLWKTKIHTTLL